MTAKMLVSTTEGFRAARTHVLVSTDVAAIQAHAKKGGTTMGFSVTYAVNPTSKEVVKLMKHGDLCQRDIKPYAEQGFSEWHFSWAFSADTWEFEDGTRVNARSHDLIPRKAVAPWARALGYR